MEQTLTAARALFAARGYAAVTMDEVAAAVGVTKPLLYIDDRAGPAPPLQPLFPSLPNPTER